MDKNDSKLCSKIREDVAMLLDDGPDPLLAEHIAACDECRDFLFEARQAMERLPEASGDYRHPSSFLSGLELELERLEQAERGKKETKPTVQTATGSKAQASSGLTKPRSAIAWGGLGALALAAGIFLVLNASHREEGGRAVNDPWSCVIEDIRSAGSGESGVELCDESQGTCEVARVGATVAAGRILRTDDKTLAKVRMSDGTSLVVDRETRLKVRGDGGRKLELLRGVLVADVVKLEQEPNAEFVVPNGNVTVLGTRFQLLAHEGRSRVEVHRGAVQLTNASGSKVRVGLGEVGVVRDRSEPEVSSGGGMLSELTWQDAGDDGKGLRGIGELRAKKPGSDEERSHAIRLQTHRVKVRIAGGIARTEVDESFQNETGEVLEGIYRFQVPSDASIERLALEVDGKLEEGAFVERGKAAAIWRGVIQNAAPQKKPTKDEIIWVPGPWIDPALLEWKRGGVFELRIYPIAAKSSRRVILAYTQRVPSVGGERHYVYPLSHDSTGTTRIGTFEVDAQVVGNDAQDGIQVRGYPMERRGEGALALQKTSFVPSGDLEISYRLPEDSREVSAWAFKPTGELGADNYVALAIRPKLPRWEEGKFRDYVLVVDASRSMVGERYRRAVDMVGRLIERMDVRDRVRVLACDVSCKSMGDTWLDPGASSADGVKQFLQGVNPDGGSNLVGMIQEAYRVGATNAGDRELRVVYWGDGSPSVGPVRAPQIAQEVERIAQRRGMVLAVGIGGEADGQVLGAMARGGNGVVVNYHSGDRASAVVSRVLGASFGVSLQRPELVFPSGITMISPRALDNIPAGGEVIVAGRMQGDSLTGSLVLKGSVGGTPFEQTYPLTIEASRSAGNAFVPRLHAGLRISDLEATEGDTSRAEIVELSRRYAVASRYTSLLVLESEAMFKAFKVERESGTGDLWTGEEVGESMESDGATPMAAGGKGYEAPMALSGGRKQGEVSNDWEAPEPSRPAPTAAPGMEPPKSKRSSAAEEAEQRRSRNREPREMVPMRRVWERRGSVTADATGQRASIRERLDQARKGLSERPEQRSLLTKVLGLTVSLGDYEEANRLSRAWTEKEPLDVDAILVRSQLAMGEGNRREAIRILTGLADVRADDVSIQTWMSKMATRMGDRDLACAHQTALAQARVGDANVVAQAVRCTRDTGMNELSQSLLSSATDSKLRQVIEQELGRKAPVEVLQGDVRVEASWDSDEDLDVSLVSETGERLSWLGDRRGRVRSEGARDLRKESLAVVNLAAGRYVIEVTRASASSTRPVRGVVRVRAINESREIPFEIQGARERVGFVTVRFESRLEPIDRGGWSAFE